MAFLSGSDFTPGCGIKVTSKSHGRCVLRGEREKKSGGEGNESLALTLVPYVDLSRFEGVEPAQGSRKKWREAISSFLCQYIC